MIYFYQFNCFPNTYSSSEHLNQLLLFALGSFVIISMLLLYYSKIPESTHPISELDNPIYQTKDILLQSNSADASFVMPETKTSVLVKIVTFILIVFLALTPFQEFLTL
jgi:hypothetical protein